MPEFKPARNILFTTVILLFLTEFGPAQTIKTLPVKGLNGPNGFALDAKGILYVANEPGKQVIRILNDSTIEKVIFSDSPDGLDFDDQGNLYIINFFSGVVLKKNNYSVDTFAKELDKPADIKWDGKENLYVSEYETGSIKKINRHGK
jgi:DNA-binding beta-propeller fold protein YncE